ncbi:MAG TPA: response regulator, partial [Solirubrobacteraceae bacterium]|nr:response regulator [Solirubrobacteraceae bacterium]
MNVDTAILLVDDHDENLLALEAVLEPTGYRLVKARSGEEALRAVLQDDFAAILLDVQMPGLDGFETAELIRTRERTSNVPIIFVTAISKAPEHVFRGYGAGAVDYLFKPVDPVVLRSKVEVFGELYERGRALAAREELLRATFECAPIGMARLDDNGAIAQVNNALCQILGMREAVLLGRTLESITHPDDADADARRRRDLLAGRTDRYETEKRLIDARGREIPAQLS